MSHHAEVVVPASGTALDGREGRALEAPGFLGSLLQHVCCRFLSRDLHCLAGLVALMSGICCTAELVSSCNVMLQPNCSTIWAFAVCMLLLHSALLRLVGGGLLCTLDSHRAIML